MAAVPTIEQTQGDLRVNASRADVRRVSGQSTRHRTIAQPGGPHQTAQASSCLGQGSRSPFRSWRPPLTAIGAKFPLPRRRMRLWVMVLGRSSLVEITRVQTANRWIAD
jgi:hypothetical protein